MKRVAYYLSAALSIVFDAGLSILTNNGVISFAKPYALRIPKELPAESSVVAFENVLVIPMDSERILKNQTVIVREGIIERIGGSGKVEIPAEAQRIDGSGKYLVPELVDMHVHIREANELLLFVANGVTSVRNLWGGTGALRWMGFPDHLEIRARIGRGFLFGPTPSFGRRRNERGQGSLPILAIKYYISVASPLSTR